MTTISLEERLGCQSGGAEQPCGCGGENCGADGCICCHQECTPIQVRDATPATFLDDNGEWWKKSTTPLTMNVETGAAPLTTYAAINGKNVTADFVMDIGDYTPEVIDSVGYCWVEFIKGDIVRYYSPMQEPSKIHMRHVPDRGWVMTLNDPDAQWVKSDSYQWRFVALKKGNASQIVELEGTVQA